MSSEITLRWMSQNLTAEPMLTKISCRIIVSLGHNELTKWTDHEILQSLEGAISVFSHF